MSERADARTTQIAEAIRAYLSRHPDAADSDEGIAAWWMPAMQMDTCTAEVALALEYLRRAGSVEQQTLPDGRVIYRGRANQENGGGTHEGG